MGTLVGVGGQQVGRARGTGALVDWILVVAELLVLTVWLVDAVQALRVWLVDAVLVVRL